MNYMVLGCYFVVEVALKPEVCCYELFESTDELRQERSLKMIKCCSASIRVRFKEWI